MSRWVVTVREVEYRDVLIEAQSEAEARERWEAESEGAGEVRRYTIDCGIEWVEPERRAK
jgi:hypothetical protein